MKRPLRWTGIILTCLDDPAYLPTCVCRFIIRPEEMKDHVPRRTSAPRTASITSPAGVALAKSLGGSPLTATRTLPGGMMARLVSRRLRSSASSSSISAKSLMVSRWSSEIPPGGILGSASIPVSRSSGVPLATLRMAPEYSRSFRVFSSVCGANRREALFRLRRVLLLISLLTNK